MPRKDLARAIDRKAYAAAREHGERREYGTVHSVDPLQIEMRGSGLMLDEEDLVVSQWVRRYDYDIGLDVGDGVVVDHLPNDDFLVADVVAALDAYPVYNYYQSVGLTGGSVMFGARIQGDTNDRFRIRADGTLEWGPGSAPMDTSLYRAGANTLKTGKLIVTARASGGGFASGYSVGISQYASGPDDLFATQVEGEVGPRFSVGATGALQFGSGAAATDTSIYRSAASEITMGASLVVGGNSTTMYSVAVDKAGGGGALYFGAPGDFIIGRMAAASGFPAHLRVTGQMAIFQGANSFVGFGNPAGLAGAPSTFGGIWYDTSTNYLRLEALTGGVAWRDVKVAPLARTLVGTLVFGTGDANYDVKLYRYEAGTLSIGDGVTPGRLIVAPATNSEYAFRSFPGFNGPNAAFAILGNGYMQWGAGGATAADVDLYRFAADFLGTHDNFGANMSTTGQVTLQAPSGLPVIFFGNAQDTNLYRAGADILASDDRLFLPKTYTSTVNPFGLQISDVYQLYVQSYVTGSAHGFIGHNAWMRGDGSWQWGTTHGNFGSRSIMFDFTQGIRFFADAAAATAGSTFSPVERFRIGNDGTISMFGSLALSATITTPNGVGIASAGYLPLMSGSANDQIIFYGSGAVERARFGPSGDLTLATNRQLGWGAGGVLDASFYREAAAVIRTDSTLHIGPGAVLALNNGSNNPPTQVEFAYYGSSRQYRHTITTGHDGGTDSGNVLDFNVWTTVDGANGLASKRVLRLSGDGKVWIGNALDTNLYRMQASTLRTDSGFVGGSYVRANYGTANEVSLGLTPGGSLGPYIIWQNGAGSYDTNLYRNSASALKTDGSFAAGGIIVSDGSIYASNTVTNSKVAIGGGAVTFGPDTNIYRSAASQLKTDGGLIVAGGLALGAQTPGAAGSLKFGDGTVMTTATPASIPDSALPPRLAPGTQVGGITVTDWNNARSSGWYDGNNAANSPVATWLLGYVVAHRGINVGDWITQRVWAFTDGSKDGVRTQWQRQCNNNVWTAWVEQRWVNLDSGNIGMAVPDSNAVGGYANYRIPGASSIPVAVGRDVVYFRIHSSVDSVGGASFRAVIANAIDSPAQNINCAWVAQIYG